MTIDPSRLELDKSLWPPHPGYGPRVIGISYFSHLVGFTVSGVEIFSDQFSPRYAFPLLDVVIEMRRALNESQRWRLAAWREQGGDRIVVFRDLPGGMVEVRNPLGRRAVASREAIEQAMDRFDADVRAFLLREFPDLLHHPAYGWWFRNEAWPESLSGDLDYWLIVSELHWALDAGQAVSDSMQAHGGGDVHAVCREVVTGWLYEQADAGELTDEMMTWLGVLLARMCAAEDESVQGVLRFSLLPHLVVHPVIAPMLSGHSTPCLDEAIGELGLTQNLDGTPFTWPPRADQP